MIKLNSTLKLILLFLMCSLMLVSSVSAIKPHKQNTNLEFSITSNFADECILTTINAPNGIITINQIDTSSGTFSFNILKGNYSQLGTYCHNIICSDGIDTTSGQECREVTPTGTEGIGVALVVILLIGVGIFGFLSFFFQRDMFLHILFLFASLLVFLYAINELHTPMLFFTSVVVVVITFVYYIINYIKEMLSSFRSKRGFEF